MKKKKVKSSIRITLENFLMKLGIGMRAKLIIIFLLLEVIPLSLMTYIAWTQFTALGEGMRNMAVEDTSQALNDSAVENIERMTTDTAVAVADFLYERDDDILYLANMEPSEEAYATFMEQQVGRLVKQGDWVLAKDGESWVEATPKTSSQPAVVSTNSENNDMNGFHYRQPEVFEYETVSLYDEIAFIDLDGNEIVKVVNPNSTKVNYPFDPEKKNVSTRENTYIKAETYFIELKDLAPGEIYVSDVIGAYVGTNYIGMYVPETVETAAEERGYDIEYDPSTQAYAGQENPNGTRFEGIVRWATPVTDDTGAVTGYVTFALNHDHIMEFVDHITPMNERYTELPSAYEGNYAFIWDYQCRSICHPRHHSIYGFDPETGDPQVPWLEQSIYDAWQQSGIEKWNDFIVGWPEFDNQSREKKPAAALTQAGLVGLDGRYLNNAPQCTGWMDLTENGGSGSFYILWSGLYKLTTAGAIPYYTGQYAPSAENSYSRRGFGFVAIGAGLEDFTMPATMMEENLTEEISANLSDTLTQLAINAIILIVLVVLIAIFTASSFTGSITNLIKGISRFRAGERQFRFDAPVKDEFGTLADSFDDMADSIVDSVNNPLVITDMDQKIIYANKEGLHLRKMPLDQLIGTHYGDNSVYPPESQYFPITALDAGKEADIYYIEETGQFIKGVAHYLLDKDGKKAGYIIETIDMTETVRGQIKSEEQRMLLDTVFSSSPDLIWYEDAEGRYMTVNPRFAAIAGRAPEDFVGATAGEMLPESIARQFTASDKEAIRKAIPLYAEETVEFFDGHSETLESVRTPVFGRDNILVGLLGFARNVTRRVSMEKELRTTQIELEDAVSDANAANQHKGAFLARMSHEIRTPMNAIIGLTSILMKQLQGIGKNDLNDDAVVDELKDNVNQIESSSQHLLSLLNDILDISKIEAGKIELIDEIMDIYKAAGTVETMVRPKCDEKNIAFRVRYDDFSPSTFKIDSLRLRQVLINLLGNAVKFTPDFGSIEFRIQNLDRKGGRTFARFSVKDTGIGISKDAEEAIFQPFEQESGSITKQYGGTGLGLAISQKIVEMLGGRLELESEVGVGSEFSFSIWLTEAEPDVHMDDIDMDIDQKFAGKHMLLIDDMRVNRIVVNSMLEESGIKIDEAEDGVDGVQMFANSSEGYYDIVLMDIQMPKMNGYDATQAIRALDRADANTVPIVALTANAFKEDIEKALSYGMNAHIAKPVDLETLIKTLFRYL